MSHKGKSQQGISLIEVLISMALGIFFLGVAVEYLVTGQQSASVQDAGSRIQENARFSFSILQDDIRHAGYNGDPASFSLPPYVYRDACGGITPCSGDLAGAAGDRLAVPFVGDADVNTDCLGGAVAEDEQVANVYWVEEVGGVSSLYCNGWSITTNTWNNNQTSQPLIDGIEHMQVQYGIVTDAGTRQFLSATNVTANTAWADVRAIRLALLVDSGLQTTEADRTGARAFVDTGTTYALLDGPEQPSDGRVKRIYTTTVELNN